MKFARHAFLASCSLLMTSGCVSTDQGLRTEIDTLAKDIPRIEAEAKALGIPVACKDIAPEPVPEAENGWLLIDRAIKKEGFRFDDVQGVSYLPYDDASFLQVEAFLSQGRDEIALIEKGARMPRSYIKRNWDVKHPVQVAYPEYSLIKSYVRLFCSRAVSSAKRGDTRQAVTDLETAFGLARIPGNEHTIISVLVQIACESITYGAMQYCVALNPAMAQELYRDWTSEYDVRAFGNVLRNEARILCTEAQNISSSAEDDLTVLFGLFAERESKLAQLETMSQQVFSSASSKQKANAVLGAQVLKYISEVIEKSESSKSLVDASEVAKQMSDSLIKKSDPTQFVNLVLADLYPKVPIAFERNNAKRSMTRALMLAVDFKQKNGRFPADLKEISFTDLDPFSMKPFGYKVVGNELRIYSVGVDRVDNDGLQLIEAEGDERQFDDVVIFPKELPAKRATGT
jgi:hypothetical protein